MTDGVCDGICDGVCDGVWLFGKDSFEECPLTGQTIYWLSVKLASADSLLAKLLIKIADYDIMHRHFAHPSKDVL